MALQEQGRGKMMKKYEEGWANKRFMTANGAFLSLQKKILKLDNHVISLG